MIAVESPLEAYRKDLERNPGQDEFGPSDTLWLLVAHCLARVSRARREARQELSELCAKALREFSAPQSRMGDQLAMNLDLVNYGLANSSNPAGSDSLARGIRGFVSQMCDAGALATAYTTVALARQIVNLGSAREQG
ncbi:MAG: hypothetical protein ABI877_05815, partial [Gemmatimonadaceae bacterium]